MLLKNGAKVLGKGFQVAMCRRLTAKDSEAEFDSDESTESV